MYDSLTRSVKEIRPLEPGHLRFYACGPTVYSYAHIGNFRSFLTADLIVRTARALGWRTTFVSNITDVGHLTDDDVADAGGEDRMEKALRSKEGERFANIWDLARHYTQAVERDWRMLNLLQPDVRPHATEHIREQILAIQTLIEKGHAYETASGVYFAVESFPSYGKLSGNTQKEMLEQAQREIVLDEEKRDPRDFALWKKDEKHLMQWYSPWGWGFPGWHIECSAMSMRYLGESFDLHSGGEDNAFPHHECEIAQSESITGKQFVQHWVHTRYLLFDGEKMAKRKGTFYTVRDLVQDMGVDALGLRYALIAVPYGKPLNFTLQSLRDATGNVERFRESERMAKAAIERGTAGGDPSFRQSLQTLGDELLGAMCEDLNTAVALAKALEGTRVILRKGDTLTSEEGGAALDFLDRVNAILGIVRSEYAEEGEAIGPTAKVDVAFIEAKIAERANAKSRKDFEVADRIRKELDALGVELRDTPEGTVWRPKAVEI